MPVSDQVPYAGSTANGVTTVFPFAFKLLDLDDLVVEVDGVEQTSGFAVSGVGSDAGGSVTFTTAPTNGSKVLLSRILPLTRETDYQYQGDFQQDVVDLDFDRIWQALQQLNQKVKTSLKLSYDTATDQIIADGATARANKLIYFDASGNVILGELADLSTSPVSTFIKTLLDDVDAASARNTLGAAARMVRRPSTGSETLVASDMSKMVVTSTASALTLPLLSAVLDGEMLGVFLNAAVSVSVQRQGSDQIQFPATGNSNTITMSGIGDFLLLWADKTNSLWRVLFMPVTVNGTFAPTIEGTSTAGSASYPSQSGVYTKIGRQITFSARVAWSGHTGTGDMLLKLTGLPVPISTFPATIGFAENLALTAGNIAQAYVDAISSSAYVRIRQVPTGGGGNGAVPMDAAADIMVSGTYFTS